MEVKTIGKFQFRKKKYDEKQVIDNVYKHMQEEKTKKKINKAIKDDLNKKLPTVDKKHKKLYGKEEYKKIRREQRNNIKKQVITKELNKAFEKEIGGGTHNNPHAPTSPNKVNKKVVQKTLDRIRGIRKRTVQRNYSQNKKNKKN